jgi:hypothetical protein
MATIECIKYRNITYREISDYCNNNKNTFCNSSITYTAWIYIVLCAFIAFALFACFIKYLYIYKQRNHNRYLVNRTRLELEHNISIQNPPPDYDDDRPPSYNNI